MKRLMHPQHGFHVVSYGDDLEAMRRAGWMDDDDKALAAKLPGASAGVEPGAGGVTTTGVWDRPNQSLAPAAILPAAPLKRGPGRPRKG